MTFRKRVYLTFFSSSCLVASQCMASPIMNGDFASCDYSGWQTDTDGGLSTANDFTVVGASPDCAASVNVDYSDTEAFFANTLYQQLDFSAASDSTFLLTMDFAVSSVLTSLNSNFIADYFVIGLFDGLGNYYDQTGSLGYLVGATDIDGADSFNLSFALDNSFVNQSGWSLDFQLLLGADDEGFTDSSGSSLILNSVSLAEMPRQEVPTPASISLFALGLGGLLLGRKKRLITPRSKVSGEVRV